MRYSLALVVSGLSYTIGGASSKAESERNANRLARYVSTDVTEIDVIDTEHNTCVLSLVRKNGRNGEYWSNTNW